VAKLVEAPWAITAIAENADVAKGTVRDLLAGKTERPIGARVAERLRDVSRESLLAGQSRDVPTREVCWLVGSLMVNRHPIAAMAQTLGRPESLLRRIVTVKQPCIRRVVYEDLTVLHDRLANVSGTDMRARKRALSLGYRAPDDYAYDGTLWEADVRDDEREARCARRDEEAYLHMEVARLSLARGMSIGQMVTELRMFSASGEQAIRRARTDLGVQWDGGRAYGPKPGQEKRIAEILEVVERWQRAGELADPWPYCVELGMMTGAKWSNLERSTKPTLTPIERRVAA
jgi:hypothetical protein